VDNYTNWVPSCATVLHKYIRISISAKAPSKGQPTRCTLEASGATRLDKCTKLVKLRHSSSFPSSPKPPRKGSQHAAHWGHLAGHGRDERTTGQKRAIWDMSANATSHNRPTDGLNKLLRHRSSFPSSPKPPRKGGQHAAHWGPGETWSGRERNVPNWICGCMPHSTSVKDGLNKC
jgi:hypothetical protein